MGPWRRPTLFPSAGLNAGAGRPLAPPAPGRAVAGTWGKAAERGLGAAVAAPQGEGVGEG